MTTCCCGRSSCPTCGPAVWAVIHGLMEQWKTQKLPVANTPIKAVIKVEKPKPCIHLHIDNQIRLQECPPCSVNRPTPLKIAVFGCDIHGECTPAKKLDGVQCCVGCLDRCIG